MFCLELKLLIAHTDKETKTVVKRDKDRLKYLNLRHRFNKLRRGLYNLRHRFNNLRHRFNNFRQFCSLCMTEQPGISAVLVLYSCLVR